MIPRLELHILIINLSTIILKSSSDRGPPCQISVNVWKDVLVFLLRSTARLASSYIDLMKLNGTAFHIRTDYYEVLPPSTDLRIVGFCLWCVLSTRVILCYHEHDSIHVSTEYTVFCVVLYALFH